MRLKANAQNRSHFLLVITFALLCATAFFTGCVSVNVGPKGPDKSTGVHIKAPSAPFEVLKNSHADGAWYNKRNGNSISYLSTCNDPSDPSLEAASRDLFNDLKNPVIVKQETISFDGREAISSEVEGKVEGVATRIRALVYKKNSCLYTLSYVGIQKNFEADRNRFDDFMSGFRAP